MPKKNIQVVPDKKGWALKRSGSTRASGRYATKKEATTEARRIAGEQNLDVIIFESNRKFTEIRTSDPKIALVGEKISYRTKSSVVVKGRTPVKENSSVIKSQTKSQMWREWALGHKKGEKFLFDEAVSRESIYGDRG